MPITEDVGHVIIVGIAVLCGLIMLKVTKKVLGLAIGIAVVAVITNVLGLW